MEHEIHKVAYVLHTIVFTDRALEAKNAQVMGEKQNLDGRLKDIECERNEQTSDTNEQGDPNMLYPSILVVQKVTCLMQIAVG